jgi:methionyl-tRNA formyltransferase
MMAATAIHNRVRGLYPWPHASTTIAGERTLILRSTPLGGTTTATPGTVVEVTRDSIHVATGRGILSLEQLKPEGRRAMTAREFLAGRPLPNGLVIGAS